MQVQLPDGSQKEVPDNATVAEVAASIGKRLAKDAIAGKVNGKVVDISARVPDGAKVEIVTPKTEVGLDTIRHSTAHLMAMAVQELFPGTQVTIGPFDFWAEIKNFKLQMKNEKHRVVRFPIFHLKFEI